MFLRIYDQFYNLTKSRFSSYWCTNDVHDACALTFPRTSLRPEKDFWSSQGHLYDRYSSALDFTLRFLLRVVVKHFNAARIEVLLVCDTYNILWTANSCFKMSILILINLHHSLKRPWIAKRISYIVYMGSAPNPSSCPSAKQTIYTIRIYAYFLEPYQMVPYLTTNQSYEYIVA